MIYADFEGILVPEDEGKQNTENLIRTNIKNMLLAFIYDYKLACFDDKFSKSFEFCLGEDAVLLTILSKKVSTVLI